MAIYSGFSHEKWWFSIAMLVHQRVFQSSNQHPLRFLPAASLWKAVWLVAIVLWRMRSGRYSWWRQVSLALLEVERSQAPPATGCFYHRKWFPDSKLVGLGRSQRSSCVFCVVAGWRQAALVAFGPRLSRTHRWPSAAQGQRHAAGAIISPASAKSWRETGSKDNVPEIESAKVTWWHDLRKRGLSLHGWDG